MKRLFDFVFAIVLLVIFSPLLLVISIFVYFQDGGEVFFRQKRIGLKGCEFSIFKFRTMILNADKVGPFFTRDDDVRITKLGSFLRKTSLDELPQLLNVVKGDMSLVGPRPDVPLQKTVYSAKEWTLRCSVRPGITGLAQAKLRSQATLSERKKLDFFYIKKQSLYLDLKIIFMTFKQVIFKGGN